MPSAAKLLLVVAATAISTSLAEEATAGFPGTPAKSTEERLIAGLLAGLAPVGKIARPVPASGGNVTVQISLTLMRVASLKDDVAEIDVWIRTEWTDPRLTWNPDEYDGISKLTLPDELIWLPDIRPYSAVEYKPRLEMVDGVWVSKGGRVIYALPARIKLECNAARNRSVSCLLVMSSMMYLGNQLDLRLQSDVIPGAGSNFIVENFSVHRNEINLSVGTMVNVEYSLTLRRNGQQGKGRKSRRKSQRKSRRKSQRKSQRRS